MLTPSSQLKTPLDAVIFDCDGTLSRIEGIDELAALNGAATAVKNLTAEAMGHLGMHPELYHERLVLTQPTRDQMVVIGDAYIRTLSEDAHAVVALYQHLQKPVFIVSAGLLPAVLQLALYLHIPEDCVSAVNIAFDTQGKFQDFDRKSPLTHSKGKREIVQAIMARHARVAFIGDGLNDMAVQPDVTRFIGYGGAFYRENIAAACEYYIKESSFAPLLPLTLTLDEQRRLNTEESALFQKGLQILSTDTRHTGK